MTRDRIEGYTEAHGRSERNSEAEEEPEEATEHHSSAATKD